MSIRRRIFFSCVNEARLSPNERSIRNALKTRLADAGYQVEEFFVSGDATSMGWSFENVQKIVRSCVGGVVLAFRRYDIMSSEGPGIVASEFNHFEGAVMHSFGLPLLIVKDDLLGSRGIHAVEGGHVITMIPHGRDATCLTEDRFQLQYSKWIEKIEKRNDVFLGYCSKAEPIANKIYKYLTGVLKLNVCEWAIDFNPATSILNEIEKAARESSGGIFLFTKDDQLEGQDGIASPRDNVLFEAGYFIHAKGKEKVLIIREKDAKMPADLGGDIYLSLVDRNNTAMIEESIRRFVENRL
jgi:hypothetical protein